MRGRRCGTLALLVVSIVTALSTLCCVEPTEVAPRTGESGRPETAAVAKPEPKLPGGLTVEQVTALVEDSDAFREPKLAACPKSIDHYNLAYWQERYPALGILMIQGLVELSEPASDPTGYETVQLTSKARLADLGISEVAADYLVPIATRRLVDIRGANPRGNERFDLTIDWQFVPTEIGKSFRLGTQVRGTWVTLERSGGEWRISDANLNDGPYLPDDY
jgi:hypothetical protein